MTTVKTLPILYKRDSKGRIQTWEIFVKETTHDYACVCTRFGKQDGKMQETEDFILSGKNIGRSNETTPKQQALLEAEAQWIKKQERKGYVQTLDSVDTDLRGGAEPMLAHRYDKFAHKIQFPVMGQPKLDGHRCIAVVDNGKVELFSRQRKRITSLPHIEKALAQVVPAPGKVILDGELYNHEYKDKFEDLTGYIRSEEPKEGHEVIEYHIYDLINDKKYGKRCQILSDLFFNLAPDNTVLRFVPVARLVSEDEVKEHFELCRLEGYEGSILRNANGKYVGKRSYDLQKVKQFDDAEFEIIGIEEGRGKLAGHAIFVCKTDANQEFKAKMKGELKTLKEYFEHSDQYIGKILTIQYQGLTGKGIPRFPIALRFRKDV